MKRQLTPVEKRKRIRRLILFGIPAVSLLWAGCQRMIGYSEEDSYCYRLRYGLLSDYQIKHHKWPTSLDDVERDIEANAYVGPAYSDDGENNSDVERTFRKYRPVMTVIWKEPYGIKINVRFTRRQSFELGVDADSALDSGTQGSGIDGNDEKPAITSK